MAWRFVTHACGHQERINVDGPYVVVMSADDYDSLMETLRVYQNPYLSDKVMRGMAQVRQGQTMAHDLVEAGA